MSNRRQLLVRSFYFFYWPHSFKGTTHFHHLAAVMYNLLQGRCVAPDGSEHVQFYMISRSINEQAEFLFYLTSTAFPCCYAEPRKWWKKQPLDLSCKLPQTLTTSQISSPGAKTNCSFLQWPVLLCAHDQTEKRRWWITAVSWKHQTSALYHYSLLSPWECKPFLVVWTSGYFPLLFSWTSEIVISGLTRALVFFAL